MADYSKDTSTMANQICAAIQIGMLGKASEGASGMAMVGVSGAIVALQAVATILGNPYPKGETTGTPEINNAITDESMTFAALVAAASFFIDKDRDGHDAVGITYGPAALLKAMEMYEKVTGEKPDPYLQPEMVKSIRDFAEEANEPLNKLLDDLKTTKH